MKLLAEQKVKSAVFNDLLQQVYFYFITLCLPGAIIALFVVGIYFKEINKGLKIGEAIKYLLGKIT